MKYSYYFVFVFLIYSSFFNLRAQNAVIKVWEKETPGAIKNPSYKEDTVFLDGNRPRIMHVSEPTLTIYKPPKPNGTAVVICPGGGYVRLAIDNEGINIAEWLNKYGITAVILKYRLPNDTIMKDKSVAPLQDAQKAIRILRRSSTEYGIDKNKIGVMGFSAGGHVASSVSTHYTDSVYASDKTSARPDFSVLVYPVISMLPSLTHQGSYNALLGKTPTKEKTDFFSNEQQVTEATPPAFIVCAADDKTVLVQNSINYFTALRAHNVPSELHLYTKGGHGFGLGANSKSTAANWPNACIEWLREMGFAK